MPDRDFEKLLVDVQVGRVRTERLVGLRASKLLRSVYVQTNSRSQEEFMESLERIISELKAHVST